MVTKLSDTTRPQLSATADALLRNAAQRDDGFLMTHIAKMPAAAKNSVATSLLKNGLVEQIPGVNPQVAWFSRGGDDIALRITDAGFRAIGTEPPTAPHAASADAVAQEAAAVADALDAAPTAPAGANGRDTLRHAAQAVLDAWRGIANLDAVAIADAMNPAIARLDAALATPAPRTERAPRGPRQGTKQEQVLAMLRRADGASGPQIAEATGWNSNTVRGFLAGLKKKGFTIETLERVRMVGPNKDGAKGSFTVYRVGG